MKPILIIFLFFPLTFLSQEESKTQLLDEFSGSIAVTNNGISLIPSFSLGDPAAILNIKMAKKDLSFEPEMRFALEGKPWSFLFWFRYQAIKDKRFKLRLGTHYGLNFRTITVNTTSGTRDLMESRRYLAAEVVPSYNLTDKISVGAYYLISKGFDDGLKRAHFLLANIAFSKIPLDKNNKYYFSLVPQFYYLRTDDIDGIYTAGVISLGKNDFPLSLQSILNKKIDSDIPSDDFVWNISLVYSFK